MFSLGFYDASKVVRWWTGRGVVFSLLLLISLTSVDASIIVAPTSAILGDRERTTTLELHNPTTDPVEVSVALAFGFPVSDSLGEITVPVEDSNITDPQSVVGWIRAFPRQVIVPPLSKQALRLMARPPADLPEGEYWGRLIVTSRPVSEPSVSTDEGAITTELRMVTMTSMTVKYRRGDPSAGLALRNVKTIRDTSEVRLLLDLVATGSASYVGVLTAIARDADGRQLDRQEINLAVYRQLTRRVIFPTSQLTAAIASVDISISTDGRTDIDPRLMIHGNRLERRIALTE